MTKKLLFVTAVLLVVALGAFAADVTGKWTFEQPGRGGNPGRPVTITLKQDGSKLTGETNSSFTGKSAITDGKIEGDNISFNIKASIQGNEMTLSYKGKIAGDTIKLSSEFGGGQAIEWTLKKQ